MTDPGRVLITGVTGFLGRHFAGDLKERGCEIRGLIRPSSLPPPEAVEPIVANDLTDRDAVRRSLRGVDTVIHLAARVHVMSETIEDPLVAYRRVNVHGTRTVVEESVRAGVERLVFISSIKAMGEESESPWTEESPPDPQDPYGVSKLEAEAVVRGIAGEGRIRAPILRLPLVYGPGMKGNMMQLFRLVDRGVPLPLGAVENRKSLVFARNVVEAAVVSMKREERGARVYLVSDGEDVSTPELIRRIAKALDRPSRLYPVPTSVLHGAGNAASLMARWLPIPDPAPRIRRLLGSLQVDVSRLRQETGYEPRFTIEEGLKETARWYRSSVRGL